MFEAITFMKGRLIKFNRDGFISICFYSEPEDRGSGFGQSHHHGLCDPTILRMQVIICAYYDHKGLKTLMTFWNYTSDSANDPM